MGDWDTYAALARHLDGVRRNEEARTAAQREDAELLAATIQTQRARMDDKAGFINHVGRLLRLRPPILRPDTSQSTERGADNVREAERWSSLAVETAERAEKRGRQALI